MKFSVPTLFTAAACFLATAEAFVPNRIARKHSPFRVSSRTAMAIETSDFGSAMPEAASYMEQLGIEEGKLALGIDPIDVYSHIGSRESLIAKTLLDIPKFDRAKAEAEVDKFLMDAEMVNMYIQYQKEVEKDPDFVVPNQDEEEGLFSLRNVLYAYIVYIGSTTGYTAFMKYVAAEQLAGTWKGTNIPFVDAWIEKTVTVAADGVAADNVQAVLADTVQAVSDAVQSQ